MIALLTILLISPSLFYFLKSILNQHSHDLHFIRKSNNLSGVLNLIGVISGFILYIGNGSHSINLFQYEGLGFSLRIDSISMIMFTMVSIIAYFVFRFSINYLAGDAKYEKFARIFSFIVGTVQLLVISGNLFLFFILWVLTSIGLHQLLQLYPDRKKALRAAKTKFVIARMADLTLLSAFVIIYSIADTGEIQQILFNEATLIKFQNADLSELVVILLGVTALLKSVQFPFHTWIFGVLESPTPVSALLHAGLLNAGPFLIIRFSMLFSGMESASTILLISGAISAIFGSTAFITQPSVKTGLVFSSIGHMGFSLMLCGLGLYAAAFLHLVSHSFYKAFLFLSSGSVISELKSTNAQFYERSGNFLKIVASLILAVAFFLAINLLISQYIEIPLALTVLGLIMVIGVFSMLVYSFDSKNTVKTSLKTAAAAFLVLTTFYLMEFSTNSFVQNDILQHESLGPIRSFITPAVVTLFLLGALIQIMVLIPSKKSMGQALRVHFRNGLYVDSFYKKLSQNRK